MEHLLELFRVVIDSGGRCQSEVGLDDIVNIPKHQGIALLAFLVSEEGVHRAADLEFLRDLVPLERDEADRREDVNPLDVPANGRLLEDRF